MLNVLLVLVMSIMPLNMFAQKTVLLTGGAGFIGSHVAQRLVERGDRVIIVDNFNDYYDPALKRENCAVLRTIAVPQAVRVVDADILDFASMEDLVRQEKPDCICHLAARAGVRPSIEQAELYVDVNIKGTLNILELVKKFHIPHLVLASSSSVYGDDTPIPFKETSSADRPCSPYAASKRAAELLAYTYHHLFGISCTCLRFFTVYGPRGRPDMAPFMFLDAIYKGKPIVQYGDGSSMRDFTYVDDIVDGILAALDKPCGFEVFNLGRGEPVALKDFIQTVEQVCGKRALINRKEMQPGDVQATFADINKAHTMLGYSPRVSLKEGITKTFDWYMQEYHFSKEKK